MATDRRSTLLVLRRARLRREELLREHKMASRRSQPDDFVFAGRIRSQPRERNWVRTAILYPAIERANELLAAEGKPPIPQGITFHSLRRTYAALRAELGEHPAITAAQMGHRDPRMIAAGVHGRHRDAAADTAWRAAQRGPMGTNGH